VNRFAPLLDALPPAQQALWPELGILGAARALFGPAFNPLIAQKTLAYFEGGDLETLPEDTRRLLVAHATRDVDVPALPKRAARLD